MPELKGFEAKKGTHRIKGAEHGAHKHRKSWLELRKEEQETLGYTEQPYVLIIGGGQGGIMLAARLRRLGVPTIVVRTRRPGHHRAAQATGVRAGRVGLPPCAPNSWC